MRYVEFYELVGDAESRFVGRIELSDDGALRVVPSSQDDAATLSRIMRDVAVSRETGEEIKPSDDPALWLENLCVSYRGSYFNATTVMNDATVSLAEALENF